jgi:hypothetical protein
LINVCTSPSSRTLFLILAYTYEASIQNPSLLSADFQSTATNISSPDETTGGLETFDWNISSTLGPALSYALGIVFADGVSPNFSNQIKVLAAADASLTSGVQPTVTAVINHPSASAAVPTSNATASATPENNSQGHGDGGLSGGALAGIVIAAIGGLALIGAAAFFFMRHRKAAAKKQQESWPDEKKRARAHSVEADAGVEAARLELDGEDVYAGSMVPGRVESDGREVDSPRRNDRYA